MNRTVLSASILLVVAGVTAAQTPTSNSTQNLASRESLLNWRPWSDTVFAEAQRSHKFVLLDLEAVWCHWCHVMDANTYSDPQVIKLLQAHYITLKVDQDSRPTFPIDMKILAGRQRSFLTVRATRSSNVRAISRQMK